MTIQFLTEDQVKALIRKCSGLLQSDAEFAETYGSDYIGHDNGIGYVRKPK